MHQKYTVNNTERCKSSKGSSQRPKIHVIIIKLNDRSATSQKGQEKGITIQVRQIVHGGAERTIKRNMNI